MGLLMAQVFGQALIVRAAKVPIQQAVQLGFQASRGHCQAMYGHASGRMTIAQLESPLQQCFDRQGELGRGRGGDLEAQVPTSTSKRRMMVIRAS